ncbi:hypothetical protein K443DRAFT_476198 [Laccaria amethystina LaAM-08-1]|uniref:Uncharacterized protein n=1 Tax=Laccaria amethystina LaAM-08-1 TaxID=1095629 RepID=A0A0C9Y5V3_9AGAR|nr:hypothetical protein K443DRAFT_476198 [Laccaria amethystina LaAM-08-1]
MEPILRPNHGAGSIQQLRRKFILAFDVSWERTFSVRVVLNHLPASGHVAELLCRLTILDSVKCRVTRWD